MNLQAVCKLEWMLNFYIHNNLYTDKEIVEYHFKNFKNNFE